MRLALKYLSATDCRPELTVGLKILSTAVSLHANAEIKARQGAINSQMANDTTATRISELNKRAKEAEMKDNIAQ